MEILCRHRSPFFRYATADEDVRQCNRDAAPPRPLWGVDDSIAVA
jgi:hypothetical protein